MTPVTWTCVTWTSVTWTSVPWTSVPWTSVTSMPLLLFITAVPNTKLCAWGVLPCALDHCARVHATDKVKRVVELQPHLAQHLAQLARLIAHVKTKYTQPATMFYFCVLFFLFFFHISGYQIITYYCMRKSEISMEMFLTVI